MEEEKKGVEKRTVVAYALLVVEFDDFIDIQVPAGASESEIEEIVKDAVCDECISGGDFTDIEGLSYEFVD